MDCSKYEQHKEALERGYLNHKVVKVIKSCKTKEQLKVAEKYLDLILMRMWSLFGHSIIADVKSIKTYQFLKNYYETLIKEIEHKIYKKEYKKTFGINFRNMQVK